MCASELAAAVAVVVEIDYVGVVVVVGGGDDDDDEVGIEVDAVDSRTPSFA